MSPAWKTWPKRFMRWLLGGPFRRLPATFGDTVPADLRAFQAEAEEAQHHGIGGVAERIPAPHAKTKPARLDSSLERQ